MWRPCHVTHVRQVWQAGLHSVIGPCLFFKAATADYAFGHLIPCHAPTPMPKDVSNTVRRFLFVFGPPSCLSRVDAQTARAVTRESRLCGSTASMMFTRVSRNRSAARA